jgi:putative transposase
MTDCRFARYAPLFKPRLPARLFLSATSSEVFSEGGTRPPDGFNRGMPIFPGRTSHRTPAWVRDGVTYHIRISLKLGSPMSLTAAAIAPTLLKSAQLYHVQRRWSCLLFLLMPDHLHALLAFPHDIPLGEVIKKWKAYHARTLGLTWQGNFFDHRIRSRDELEEKAAYIRLNPVRKSLCAREEDWPWSVTCVV